MGDDGLAVLSAVPFATWLALLALAAAASLAFGVAAWTGPDREGGRVLIAAGSLAMILTVVLFLVAAKR